MRSLLPLIVLCLATFACGGPAPSSTPPPADDIEGLIADLTAAAAPAREVGRFNGMLLGGEGHTICVGAQTVSVHLFASPSEAAAAAARVDPRDPSHVGNGIVEWVGPPKFWLRGSMVIYYVGTGQAVIDVLVEVLGEPFAVGMDFGRGPMPGGC